MVNKVNEIDDYRYRVIRFLLIINDIIIIFKVFMVNLKGSNEFINSDDNDDLFWIK